MVTIGNHYSSNSPITSEPLSIRWVRTKWKYHYFPLIGHGNIGYQPIFGAFMELVRSPVCFSFPGNKGNVLEILCIKLSRFGLFLSQDLYTFCKNLFKFVLYINHLIRLWLYYIGHIVPCQGLLVPIWHYFTLLML